VAKGITWNNQAILDEHLRLRGTYPDVKLRWSGGWSTYDGRNFWVTLVGLHFDNPYDLLDWRTQQGFDRDNCIAKIVGTTHPIEGSTKLLLIAEAELHAKCPPSSESAQRRALPLPTRANRAAPGR
jgi:hypothetical protein